MTTTELKILEMAIELTKAYMQSINLKAIVPENGMTETPANYASQVNIFFNSIYANLKEQLI